MDGVEFQGKDGERIQPSISSVLRGVRKMHSVDRRIKSAHHAQNPDQEEKTPSYMRQTCSSLIKRSSFKTKSLETFGRRLSGSHDGDLLKKPHDGERKMKRRSKSCTSPNLCSSGASFARNELSTLRKEKGKKPVTRTSSEPPIPKTKHQPSPQKTDPDDAVIQAVQSNEPNLEEADISFLMEACYDEVIHEALISGGTSNYDEQEDRRGPSFTSTLTMIESYSDLAPEESFCMMMYDDDLETKSDVHPHEVFKSAFFHSTMDSPPPPTPFTSKSEKLDSENIDDAFDDETKWLEDDNESVEELKLQSHKLEDILGSCSDSEFGDENLLNAFSKSDPPIRDINKHIPLHKISLDDTELDRRMNSKYDCKVERTNESRRIQQPNLLWMLGGNLLAGMVGAAIASTGLPSAHGTSPIEPNIDSKDELDVHENDSADDWFFDAVSR